MGKWTLNRTQQCSNCPWKIGSDVNTIENYNVDMHRRLENTIADPNNYNLNSNTLPIMLCHHSEQEGDEQYCIGWLWNQLGEGNNIPLRMKMMSCTNAGKIKTFGEQHECFEDTLPE